MALTDTNTGPVTAQLHVSPHHHSTWQQLHRLTQTTPSHYSVLFYSDSSLPMVDFCLQQYLRICLFQLAFLPKTIYEASALTCPGEMVSKASSTRNYQAMSRPSGNHVAHPDNNINRHRRMSFCNT